jgi:hypothetical protein
MIQKIVQRLGLSLILTAALFGAAVFPVFAASPAPTITVVAVDPGSQVQLSISNLPAGEKFAVTMGPAGSLGVGPVVAHVFSSDGSTVTDWFEILADVSGNQTIQVRVDNGAGLSAFTFFDNSGSPSTSVMASPAATVSTPAAIPVTGASGVTPVGSGSGSIQVLHAEMGGWVQALIHNLPADTVFTVTVGMAGSQGIGGYGVGTLTTDPNTSGLDAVGTFEIPVLLASEASLDLRLDSGSAVYIVTFKNANY